MRGLLHTEGEIVTTGTERLRVEVKSTIPGELHMHYAAPIIQCATGRIRNQVEKTLRSGRSPQEKKKFPYGGIQSGGAMVTTGSRAPVRPRYISSQAMPAYPSSSTRLSLSGGGGGSDGGNGSDGPPEKKELELYPPPQHLYAACDLLKEKMGPEVEVVPLPDNLDEQRVFRNKLFNKKRIHAIEALQKSARFAQVTKVENMYIQEAEEDAYIAGPIDRRTHEAMLDIPEELSTELSFLNGAAGTPIRFANFACGNAEENRMYREARKVDLPFAHIEAHKPPKGIFTNAAYEAGIKAARSAIKSHGDPNVDPNNYALDIADGFVAKAIERGFNGKKVDICGPAEDFFRITGIRPNSLHRINMNFAFDRLRDLGAVLEIMRRCARMDGTTEFIFGQAFPMSSETDSLAKKLKPITCFDPIQDAVRQNWTDPNIEMAIYHFMEDLIYSGFKVERIGERRIFEVYSPHCPVAASPEEFVEQFADLRGRDFIDPETNEKRDRIFNNQMRDDDFIGDKVALPQAYPLTFVAGKITKPIESSEFDFSTDVTSTPLPITPTTEAK